MNNPLPRMHTYPYIIGGSPDTTDMSKKATSRLCDSSSKLRLAAEESSRNLAFAFFDMLKCGDINVVDPMKSCF